MEKLIMDKNIKGNDIDKLLELIKGLADANEKMIDNIQRLDKRVLGLEKVQSKLIQDSLKFNGRIKNLESQHQ
jgi:hypothetical protein